MFKVTVIGQGQAAVYRQTEFLAWNSQDPKRRGTRETPRVRAGPREYGKGIRVDRYS